jgi:hypothetical protein
LLAFFRLQLIIILNKVERGSDEKGHEPDTYLTTVPSGAILASVRYGMLLVKYGAL